MPSTKSRVWAPPRTYKDLSDQQKRDVNPILKDTLRRIHSERRHNDRVQSGVEPGARKAARLNDTDKKKLNRALGSKWVLSVGNDSSVHRSLYVSYEAEREAHMKRRGGGCPVKGRNHVASRSAKKRKQEGRPHVTRTAPGGVTASPELTQDVTRTAPGGVTASPELTQGTPRAPNNTAAPPAASLSTTTSCAYCRQAFGSNAALSGHLTTCSAGLSSADAGLENGCVNKGCSASAFKSISQKRSHVSACPFRPGANQQNTHACATCGWLLKTTSGLKRHQKVCNLSAVYMLKQGLVRCGPCWQKWNGWKTTGPRKAPNVCVFKNEGLKAHMAKSKEHSMLTRMTRAGNY